ncbi:hypothetical protein MMC07_005081 [Pseudocyphellaria aurata]|nr:hypothetical protein [Pseudocyphellaria aurata]
MGAQESRKVEVVFILLAFCPVILFLLCWTVFLAFSPCFIRNHIHSFLRYFHELVIPKAIFDHYLRGVQAVMPSARGRRVRIADEEQHLIFDPSSPVISEREREVHRSTVEDTAKDASKDTFESLLEEVRQDRLSNLVLLPDGSRSRYTPPGSARRHTSRDQPSLQEFLNSSEDHFPASSTDVAAESTALRESVKPPHSISTYNTFSVKEDVKSSRSPSTGNGLGLKESEPSSSSPSMINTSVLKENIKKPDSPSTTNTFTLKRSYNPSGSSSLTTLRHKISSMMIREASGRDENRNQAPTLMPNLESNITNTPIYDERVFGLSNEQSQDTQSQASSTALLRPAAMASPTNMASTATIANSTDQASQTMTGSPIDTTSFAAKVKDKAIRRKPLLTVDTARSNKSSAIPAAISSAHGQSINDNGLSETGEDLNGHSGLTDSPSLNPQKAYEDEALEVSPTKGLTATDEASSATTESSPSRSPAKIGKSLLRNFAFLKPARSDPSETNKGALHSPKEAGPNASPRSAQKESSKTGAQAKGKAKAEEEEEEEGEDLVAIKVNKLREQTGSQVVWYKPDDLRCRHPNHHRTWYSKNLRCTTHNGRCANCGAPCCAMVGALNIVEQNKGSATVVAAAKALAEAIGLWVVVGMDESTLMECTSCHRLVCPECCSVCPVAICGDRVCKAPGCNPDRQWEICDLHHE